MGVSFCERQEREMRGDVRHSVHLCTVETERASEATCVIVLHVRMRVYYNLSEIKYRGCLIQEPGRARRLRGREGVRGVGCTKKG